MEADRYKVDIVHFLNPYLIWATGIGGQLEQIGIFGVLPVDLTIDPDQNSLVMERGAEWMPAAAKLMREAFVEAKEVTFCVEYIDDRNSIFDDNIHKYGELILKKPNGKYIFLSSLLVKSKFAVPDKLQFLEDLFSGNLKTTLTHYKIKEVTRLLEHKCKNQVEKQMRVFHRAEEIESALTIRNLEAHNRKNEDTNMDQLLQQNIRTLKLCKDVECESIGRGSARNRTSNSSDSLKKKLLLHKNIHGSEGKNVVDYFNEQRRNDLKTVTPRDERPEEIPVISFQEDIGALEPRIVHDDLDKKDTRLPAFIHKKREILSGTASLPHDDVGALEPRRHDDVEKTTEGRLPAFIHKKRKLGRIPCPKVPKYDALKQVLVAYGPPDVPHQKLKANVVPKEQFTEDPCQSKREDPIDCGGREKEDNYGEVDSDVDVYIPKVSPKTDSAGKVTNVFKNDNVNVRMSSDRYAIDAKEAEINKIYTNANLKASTDVTKQKAAIPSNFEAISNRIQKHTSNVRSPDNVRYAADEKTVSPSNLAYKPSETVDVSNRTQNTLSSLKKRVKLHKEIAKKLNSSTSDTSNKDSSTSIDESNKLNASLLDSDDDTVSEVIEQINSEYQPLALPTKEVEVSANEGNVMKNNVNPFKNVDPNISVFVDKLVTPVLMVHSKNDKRFQAVFKLSDVNFNNHIKIVLKNMSVEKPMMLQSISWAAILRGHSLVMVSPKGSGKTMGYLPSVCRLVSDRDSGLDGVGPICIVVCATANSVTEVERLAKVFTGKKDKVLAFYTGMDELDMTTSLLNGCDMLVCTPPILVRLLQADFGVNLRRLTTFVIDDCERISEVYMNEVKFFLHKIKEVFKVRVLKELKVQFVLASRTWCDFMAPLAKKAPNTAICVGAFQECVLYSKARTTASFVTKENKINSVLDFLTQIDTSKRTVIVCRTDAEVNALEKALKVAKHVVFACNTTMTVVDLYNLRTTWDDYQEPIIGPILLCCDDNLLHLNVTDAHYLVQYSLPHLFSMFCKRFSVLNDNYASIFKENNEGVGEATPVKVKILLEDENVEQLPKILHFIKRCTSDVPPVFDAVCERVLLEKDVNKAKKLVPICDTLMASGKCPDFWNCQDRHTFLKEHDDPKDWVPKTGVVTFKMLHYHSAVLYSARLLTNVTKGETVKYPQNYNMLAMKISMYFSRESNRRPLGVPQVGDKGAVSITQNFFVRCQVVRILNYYPNGKPNYVLIRLIDEEKLEKTRDVDLYYLPEDLLKTETHVVHVRLANIQPKDRDIQFSDLARDQLKSITDSDEDLYMRGQITLTVGNCVFVDTLETCRDLSTMNKTIVRHDFKQELLDRHAIPNPEHLTKLEKLCADSGLVLEKEEPIQALPVQKKLPKEQWAHLDQEDYSDVLFASAVDPGSFFVRLVKFKDFCNILIKDIQKHIAEHTEKVLEVSKGDIVLAKLPDDGMYERARIDEVLNDDRVYCFFVDQGDWRAVPKHHLAPITEKLINQLPFQAIECRLVGVKPYGETWTEFATNWFTNCFEDNSGNLKQIYAKYFTKENAQFTGSHKYGVVLVDTNGDKDIVINNSILDLNLAQTEDTEYEYVKGLDSNENNTEDANSDDEDKWEKVSKTSSSFENDDLQKLPLSFTQQPIRSVPLVDTDDESGDSEERWQINMDEDLMAMFKPAQSTQSRIKEVSTPSLPALKQSATTTDEISLRDSETDSNADRISLGSDLQTISLPRLKELDSDDLTSPEPTQVSSNIKINESDKENNSGKVNLRHDRPVRKVTKDSPVKTVTNDSPVKIVTKDSSVKIVTKDSPVKIVPKDSPVKTVTKDSPVKTVTKDSPVKIVPKDSSVKIVTKDSPVKTVTKDSPVKTVTKNCLLKMTIQQTEFKKPRVYWWQKEKTISIKIQLIGVENYNIDISERRLKFDAIANDTEYGFDLELYGVVDPKKCEYLNKGQYILVKLVKVLDRNWLNLTKKVHKWITYDVDSIDVSSDDDEQVGMNEIDVIKNMHNNDSESEEEEFVDDLRFSYSK